MKVQDTLRDWYIFTWLITLWPCVLLYQHCPFPGLAGMFCRGTTSACHGRQGSLRRDTAGVSVGVLSSGKRRWMEKHEWSCSLGLNVAWVVSVATSKLIQGPTARLGAVLVMWGSGAAPACSASPGVASPCCITWPGKVSLPVLQDPSWDCASSFLIVLCSMSPCNCTF